MIPLLATLVVRAVCGRSMTASPPQPDAARLAQAPDWITAPEQPIPVCSAAQPAARAPPLLPPLAPADAQALITLFSALARRQADPSAAEVTDDEPQNHERTAQPQSLRLCP